MRAWTAVVAFSSFTAEGTDHIPERPRGCGFPALHQCRKTDSCWSHRRAFGYKLWTKHKEKIYRVVYSHSGEYSIHRVMRKDNINKFKISNVNWKPKRPVSWLSWRNSQNYLHASSSHRLSVGEEIQHLSPHFPKVQFNNRQTEVQIWTLYVSVRTWACFMHQQQ